MHALYRKTLILLASVVAAKGVDFQTHRINPAMELLITDVAVVDSPQASYPGIWSWGHLMEQALGKEEAPQKVAEWLDSWRRGQISNPQDPTVKGPAPREEVSERIILNWQKRDGYAPGSREPWKPNLANAPFRLLAIVNRMDLGLPIAPKSGSGGYYGSNSTVDSTAGEARLVYCLVDGNDRVAEPGLTLIAEYGLDASKEGRRLDWAIAWHALGEHKAFDGAYLDALATLSRCFIDKRPEKTGNPLPPAPEKPPTVLEHLNQDAAGNSMQLLRLRINDGVTGKVREFREFAVREGNLSPAVLPGAPAAEFFDEKKPANRELTQWLEDEAARQRSKQEIELRDKVIKERLPIQIALPATLKVSRKEMAVGTFALPALQPEDHWNGWAMRDPELRRTVSLNSCCGCHCGDTNSAFFHVFPREKGEASALSKYLRTDGTAWRIKDPQSNDRLDSHEIEDRAEFLSSILKSDLSLTGKLEFRRSRGLRVH